MSHSYSTDGRRRLHRFLPVDTRTHLLGVPPPLSRRHLYSTVHKALSSCPASVVVVHFVAGSKTGICSPSEGVLTELQERYGERLVVSWKGVCLFYALVSSSSCFSFSLWCCGWKGVLYFATRAEHWRTLCPGSRMRHNVSVCRYQWTALEPMSTAKNPWLDLCFSFPPADMVKNSALMTLPQTLGCSARCVIPI